ncbi:tRNA (adenosine(37)-N6)-threonylcarbamoyltransferase complex dimerization subunit type 1 TsaB [Alkalicaulis satelles]|uniref:tRNA (Adenosine(37)-N6)-threonylcarbamoyltransferase complex dimerization subunit type 1 TsaB n=1 Tax=Alkalicaulis satelles TaxID=2609175 RepID=A0A5M6ZH68_9PROT|nr:tRNA (adenosine(37)-N6)-threonylcarbamoyltransferase complex dimerization subunit type 1 TsaB [Alkalicaulis satelles]KAA5803485.1 tRNA (adenosine(37)-N6)-threonylcarbamoyltransferase complex dimerization subunit type 1 TsaB [Alkalicaulis satelles]
MRAAVLVIDTSTSWCACALEAGGRVARRSEDIGRGHAEVLAPWVRDLMDEAGVAPRDLMRIGVNTGPGGFAGVRVGVAFARGLALAAGAQAVGVTALDAWARRADPDASATVFSVHDARRGELIWRVYRDGDALADPVRGDLEAARIAFDAHPGARLAGSGAALLGAPDDPAAPLDALLALTRAAPGDAPSPAPVYARAPDAKRAGEGA